MRGFRIQDLGFRTRKFGVRSSEFGVNSKMFGVRGSEFGAGSTMAASFSLVRIAVFMIGLTLLVGCGGGSSFVNTNPVPPTPVANSVTVNVNSGPANNAVNFAYVSVSLCNTGGTATCVTIPDVQVDTGSSGLRILASAPGVSSLALTPVTGGGSSVYECDQFAGGTYLWGQVVQAGVKMAGETATNVPIQIISSDAAPASVASNCNPLGGNNLGTPAALQANGILGVGTSIADCGTGCTGSSVLPLYWLCSNATTCTTPAAIPIATQVSNPVAFFGSDNNGVVLTLGTVAPSGAATATGTLLFGNGTQTDNAIPSSAKVYALGASVIGTQVYLTILAAYNGNTYPAFIDSSQTTNIFLDSGTVAAASAGAGITSCTQYPVLYCTGSGASLPVTMEDSHSDSAQITLPVGDGATLLNSSVTNGGSNAAFGNLTGGYALGASDYVDLGLPFFYGRSVFVGISGEVPPTGVSAPLGYWAF